jgi:REP element-mobilizing transposase RayT
MDHSMAGTMPVLRHGMVRDARVGIFQQPAEVWQRNYDEHIIRDDGDLHRIGTYIENNPLRWALDEENQKKP